jgi:hypothetical protein
LSYRRAFRLTLLQSPMHRSTLRDLLLLTALCAVIYFLGLTSHGLTNWQEAQRALTARDMHARGDWIVPTINGRPYLAKPPVIYWCQMALASIRGPGPDEFDLRLTAALGAWLGVLATYVVARRILGQPTALWSSLFLATGLLYVHSARVGEIDILLVPFTVVAAGALYSAWRTQVERRRTNVWAIAIAILGAWGVMLTKGPPALLVVALAGYGGIALAEAWRADRGGGSPSSPSDNRGLWLASVFVGLVAVGYSAWFHRFEKWNANAFVGLVLLALIAPPVIATLIRLCSPQRAFAVLRLWGRTHAVLVLGLAFLPLYVWGKMVEARIGAATVANAVKIETENNLRFLVPDSSFDNLLAASFGVGLGSLTAAVAIWWWLRQRRATPQLWFLLAWMGGGIFAFSVLGKGVPRYLSPVWPGVAMFGGWWFALMLDKVRAPRRLATLGAAAVLVLAAGQSWWYADGREQLSGDRSPRAIVRELLALPDADPSRIVTYDFKTPMLDYYVGRRLPAFDDDSLYNLSNLRARCIAKRRPFVVLIREHQTPRLDPRPAIDRLRSAGFELEQIPLHSRFTIDKWHTPIIAVRVRPLPALAN